MYSDNKTTVEVEIWQGGECTEMYALKNNNNDKVDGRRWEEEEDMSQSIIH